MNDLCCPNFRKRQVIQPRSPLNSSFRSSKVSRLVQFICCMHNIHCPVIHIAVRQSCNNVIIIVVVVVVIVGGGGGGVIVVVIIVVINIIIIARFFKSLFL